MDAGEPAFKHLPRVEQQVPPIGDLHGRRRAQRGAAPILGRAVACDDLHLRLAAEPGGQRQGGAVRQQVNGALPFEVDQDGAVAPTLAQRPVIDSDDVRPAPARQRHASDRSQHGGSARRHGELQQQPSGGLTTKGEPGSGMSLSEAAGALGMAAEQAREAFGKGAARAARMAAGEAAHPQV